MAHRLLVSAAMGSHTRLLLLTAIATATLLQASSSAWADDPEDPPPAANPYGPGQPVFVAPLSQQTQTTYVPQSVALSGPKEIAASDDTRPAPAGYTAVMRPRRHLIVGGAVTLGVSYSISAMVAAIGDDTSDGGRNEVGAMWIPVAGPFIQLADTNSSTARVFLAGLGGAQLAGAIMLYYGLTTQQRIFVRNDLVGSMTILPTSGNGVSGMALAGRF
jgi:hypothetical protein